jgi:hypothetical protein
MYGCIPSNYSKAVGSSSFFAFSLYFFKNISLIRYYDLDLISLCRRLILPLVVMEPFGFAVIENSTRVLALFGL